MTTIKSGSEYLDVNNGTLYRINAERPHTGTYDCERSEDLGETWSGCLLTSWEVKDIVGTRHYVEVEV